MIVEPDGVAGDAIPGLVVGLAPVPPPPHDVKPTIIKIPMSTKAAAFDFFFRANIRPEKQAAKTNGHVLNGRPFKRACACVEIVT